VEKVPRRNLGCRKILCLITAFVMKLTAERLAKGLSEGLEEGLLKGLAEGLEEGLAEGLTLFSVGYFLRTESVGGAYMPPQCIFGNFFGDPPKEFFFTIFFIGLMGSYDIFRKSQRVSACTFERKGAFSMILRLGGHICPPPRFIGLIG
jgi:hypothetical protein